MLLSLNRIAAVKARVLVAAGIAIAVAACAPSPSTSSTPSSVTRERVGFETANGAIDMTLLRDERLSEDTVAFVPARVWPALIQAYASLGAPLQGADAPRHAIATQFFRPHGTFAGLAISRLLDCGSGIMGENATSYQILMRVATVVDTSVAGRSIMRTAIAATAVAPGGGTTTLHCQSMGVLERRLVALVVARAQQ